MKLDWKAKDVFQSIWKYVNFAYNNCPDFEDKDTSEFSME